MGSLIIITYLDFELMVWYHEIFSYHAEDGFEVEKTFYKNNKKTQKKIDKNVKSKMRPP